MKRSNAISAMATILMFAAHLSSAQAGGYVNVNAGLLTNGATGALGIGTGYQNGLCGAPCNGVLSGYYSNYSTGYLGSQYAGLPSALPKQMVPLRVAQAPFGPSGWVNGGAGGYGYGNGMNNMYGNYPYNGMNGGFPFNGMNNMYGGYPYMQNGMFNGMPFNGAYNGFPGAMGPFGNQWGNPMLNNMAMQSPCGICSSAYNNRYAMPMPLNNFAQQVPGAPCGLCGASNGLAAARGISGIGSAGGSTIINMRTPASYEMADSGLIALGTGLTVMNMNSSVFPVDFPRYQQTIPEVPTWIDNRSTGFVPRPDLHSSSAFQ